MLCNIDYIYNIKESFRTLLQGLLLARVYQLITPFVVSHNKHNRILLQIFINPVSDIFPIYPFFQANIKNNCLWY